MYCSWLWRKYSRRDVASCRCRRELFRRSNDTCAFSSERRAGAGSTNDGGVRSRRGEGRARGRGEGGGVERVPRRPEVAREERGDAVGESQRGGMGGDAKETTASAARGRGARELAVHRGQVRAHVRELRAVLRAHRAHDMAAEAPTTARCARTPRIPSPPRAINSVPSHFNSTQFRPVFLYSIRRSLTRPSPPPRVQARWSPRAPRGRPRPRSSRSPSERWRARSSPRGRCPRSPAGRW